MYLLIKTPFSKMFDDVLIKKLMIELNRQVRLVRLGFLFAFGSFVGDYLLSLFLLFLRMKVAPEIWRCFTKRVVRHCDEV